LRLSSLVFGRSRLRTHNCLAQSAEHELTGSWWTGRMPTASRFARRPVKDS